MQERVTSTPPSLPGTVREVRDETRRMVSTALRPPLLRALPWPVCKYAEHVSSLSLSQLVPSPFFAAQVRRFTGTRLERGQGVIAFAGDAASCAEKGMELL